MNKIKKVKVKEEGVKIKVDMGTVWSFTWRFYLIVLVFAFLMGLIAGLL